MAKKKPQSVKNCDEAATKLGIPVEELDSIAMWIAERWGPVELANIDFKEPEAQAKLDRMVPLVEQAFGDDFHNKCPSAVRFCIHDTKRRLRWTSAFAARFGLTVDPTCAVRRLLGPQQSAAKVAEMTTSEMSSRNAKMIGHARSPLATESAGVANSLELQLHHESAELKVAGRTKADHNVSSCNCDHGSHQLTSSPRPAYEWNAAEVIFTFTRDFPSGYATFILADVVRPQKLDSISGMIDGDSWRKLVMLLAVQMPFDPTTEALYFSFQAEDGRHRIMRAVNAASFNSALRLAKTLDRNIVEFKVKRKDWSGGEQGVGLRLVMLMANLQ